LGENLISGLLPLATLVAWSDELVTADLNSNQLRGSLSSGIGHLTHLTYLDLAVNELTSTLPTEIGSMTQIRKLYLDKFRGTVPSSLGSLTNLEYLTLYGNDLSGSISQELCRLIESNSTGPKSTLIVPWKPWLVTADAFAPERGPGDAAVMESYTYGTSSKVCRLYFVHRHPLLYLSYY